MYCCARGVLRVRNELGNTMAGELDLLVFACSIATLGQYIWSMRAHFRSSAMPSGALVISAAVLATAFFFFVLLWANVQPATAQVFGLALTIASSVLFWWAIVTSRTARLRFAFDPGNPDSLVTHGPYLYIRHPFYASYLVFWTGFGVATWSAYAVLPVAGLFLIYVIAARDEEAKFLRTELADPYASYKSRTGRFFPRLRRARMIFREPDDQRRFRRVI